MFTIDHEGAGLVGIFDNREDAVQFCSAMGWVLGAACSIRSIDLVA